MGTDDKSSKQELAATLLAEYMQADNEVARVKQLLEEVNKKRSDVVKQMYEKLGKGPFSYKGEYLGKIVVRGSTYFLRSQNSPDIIKVD